VKTAKNNSLLPVDKRMEEMESFYLLMEIHYNNFLTAWAKERKKIYKSI
jgi:hypothetical protein